MALNHVQLRALRICFYGFQHLGFRLVKFLLLCIQAHKCQPWLAILGIDIFGLLQIRFGFIHLALLAHNTGQPDIGPGLLGVQADDFLKCFRCFGLIFFKIVQTGLKIEGIQVVGLFGQNRIHP